MFAEHGGSVDPVALDRAGKIYVADCAIPRRDTRALFAYLQVKYGVERFRVLEPVSVTASVKPIFDSAISQLSGVQRLTSRRGRFGTTRASL